jgi:DNA invertase Pin-like site-specific DNA recombinase
MNTPTHHQRNAAIYTRVSTKDQSINTSLASQLKIIIDYCKSNSITYDENYIYTDEDSAFRNPKITNINDINLISRPGLNKLILAARLGKFDTVVVYSHDRLTRNVQEYFLLKYLFNNLKIQIIYCRPGEDIDTKNADMNNFFDTLLNSLAQLESSIISSRVKLGCEYNVKTNYWAGGPPPYGYRLQKVSSRSRKSTLEIQPHEAIIVREIFDYYILGYTPKDISSIIKTKYPYNSDRLWTINTIKPFLVIKLILDKLFGIEKVVQKIQ